MEIPRLRRNHNYMLNPNNYGYRPERPTVNEPEPSAKATCSTYDGDKTSYALREVQPYSEILKDEVPTSIQQEIVQPVLTSTEIKIPSGLIYQDSNVGTAV